jgi:A/G-specific adenine glycosylase
VEPEIFAKSLLQWYKKHRRDLPWRHTKDPYLIWLSEIILQQTRVNQGLPYYERFVETYPTVFDLANAPESEVLRLWQGLGYYSRARNLLFTAQLIAKENDGIFPNSFQGLLKLKGIGRYTASAIASFAYQEKVPVVDGNVYRVLSRVFGMKHDIASPAGQKAFLALAETLVPSKQIDHYNQAIMEFGALQCVPKSPDCPLCPLQDGCYAFQHDAQTKLPVKKKKLTKKTRYLNYLVIEEEETYYMRERKEKDIWKGLYEFPLIESDHILEPDELPGVLEGVSFSIEGSSGTYKHVLSHRDLIVKFWLLGLTKVKKSGPELTKMGFKKYNLKKINELPKPILLERFLKDQLY